MGCGGCAGELLSVISIDFESRSWQEAGDDAEEFKQTRFATAEEIAACDPIRAALCPGDRVVHYQHMDITMLPDCLPASLFEQLWDVIATEGRTGLVLLRSTRCVLRVCMDPAPEEEPY